MVDLSAKDAKFQKTYFEWQATAHDISLMLDLSKQAYAVYKANPTKENAAYFIRVSQQA
jgi:phage anti-repressor protein